MKIPAIQFLPVAIADRHRPRQQRAGGTLAGRRANDRYGAGRAVPNAKLNDREGQNRTAFEAEMEAVLATAATDHWAEVLEAADVPCGPVYNYAQLSIDPQVRHRGLVQYARDPELGEVPHIAPR